MPLYYGSFIFLCFKLMKMLAKKTCSLFYLNSNDTFWRSYWTRHIHRMNTLLFLKDFYLILTFLFFFHFLFFILSLSLVPFSRSSPILPFKMSILNDTFASDWLHVLADDRMGRGSKVVTVWGVDYTSSGKNDSYDNFSFYLIKSWL